jgi:hypothetical protein
MPSQKLVQESSRFFEKQGGAPGGRHKKLLRLISRDFATPKAQINKSIFGFGGAQPFSSEKEPLFLLVPFA